MVFCETGRAGRAGQKWQMVGEVRFMTGRGEQEVRNIKAKESHESSPRSRGSDRSRDYLDETSCFDVRERFRTLQKKRRKKAKMSTKKSREDQGWYLNTLRRDEQGTGLTGTVHAQLEAAAICKQDAYQDGKL